MAALAAAAGCSALEKKEGAELTQVESQLLRYEGPYLDVLLGTGAAQAAVGQQKWLILEMALSGSRRRNVKVQREAITLETPAGKTYPLASVQDLGEEWGELNAFIQRYEVARAPMEFRVGDRQPCNLPFFATPPGSATVSDLVFVNDRDFCRGLIYFRLDGFVQPGRYALFVRTDETQVGIPVELEAPER
jgi:hypothetical protein